MRGEWHVYNIKRRMTSLPPISLQIYETQLVPAAAQSSSETSNQSSLAGDEEDGHNESSNDNDFDGHDFVAAEDEDTFISSPDTCLFCLATSENIDENLAHMALLHGFQIPKIEHLQPNVVVFLGYLTLVINRCCSCLYCGRTKSSAEAIRTHMLDKGHCMLDLSPGSEYLEFWDASENDNSSGNNEEHFSPRPTAAKELRKISSTEMLLPSGAIASNKHSITRSRNLRQTGASSNQTSLVQTSRSRSEHPELPQPKSASKSQALSLRDQTGLIGLSDFKRRTLVAAQRKVSTKERKDKSGRSWVLESDANRQKNFRVSSQELRISLFRLIRLLDGSALLDVRLRMLLSPF